MKCYFRTTNLGMVCLKFRHSISMVLVWRQWQTRTIRIEWLTVRCSKPTSLRNRYAFQWTDITVVPGSTFSWIIRINVSASQLLTGAKIILRFSLSISPKTHWPSTIWPLLYLRWSNLASSISADMAKITRGANVELPLKALSLAEAFNLPHETPMSLHQEHLLLQTRQFIAVM